MLDCRSVYSICWDIFPGCIEKTILETSSPRLRWDISRWPVRRPRQHLQHLSCTPWYARLCGPVVRLTTRCLRSSFGRPNHQIKRLLSIFQEESTTSTDSMQAKASSEYPMSFPSFKIAVITLAQRPPWLWTRASNNCPSAEVVNVSKYLNHSRVSVSNSMQPACMRLLTYCWARTAMARKYTAITKANKGKDGCGF